MVTHGARPIHLFRCLLLLAIVAPATALADQDYLDYLFRSASLQNDQLTDSFKQVLADVGQRHYLRADKQMGDILSKVDPETLDPAVHARLLTDAGIIKAVTNQDAKAVSLLEQSIKTVEESVQRFSPLQFNALMVEGMLQARAHNYSQAVQLFRRAQHVLHLQDGVYTRKQLPVLDQLTSIDQARGLLLDADLEQRFDLRIAERAYGANSEALIPTLEKLGNYFADRGDGVPRFLADADAHSDWWRNRIPDQFLASTQTPIADQSFAAYDSPGGKNFGNQIRYFRASLFDQAVEMYNRAIKILENKYGPNDLRLVQPLKGLAKARLLEGAHRKLSRQAMERATRIVESNPSTDVEDHVNALVQLADLYIITGDSRARERYQDAWKLLTEHPGLKHLKTQLFSKPKRIFPAPVSFVLSKRPSDTKPGEPLYVDLKFTVDTQGVPRSIRVVDTNVPASNKDMFVRYFGQKVRYRPRLVKGKLSDTTGVTWRQRYVAPDPSPKQAPAATSASTKAANKPGKSS